MKKLLLVFLLLCNAEYSMGQNIPNTKDQNHIDPNSPHIHLSLTTYPSPILATQDDVEKNIKIINAEFLKPKSEYEEIPLSPCSLLAAGFLSIRLNAIWYQLLTQGTIPLPPPGTFLLGKYDDELKNGRIPRDDPTKTADILARLFIGYSWASNSEANTIIHELTQPQCLTLLTSDTDTIAEHIKNKLSNPNQLIFSHSQTVSFYSPIISKPDSEQFLSDLQSISKQTQSSKSSTNPLFPCSLLKSLRLSSQINELWNSILKEKIDSNNPLVGSYSKNIKNGTIPKGDLVLASQIAAHLFGSQIIASNKISDILINDTNQKECLNEIFQPGLIRSRLIKEGKLPAVN